MVEEGENKDDEKEKKIIEEKAKKDGKGIANLEYFLKIVSWAF